MSCRKYLLSVSELWNGTVEHTPEQVRELACAKLDGTRLQKLQKINSDRGRCQCIGAGLLIQLALQDVAKDEVVIQCFNVSELLAKLGSTVEVEYTYGEKGKPALKDRSLSFNLSHSEEYVFGVFADEEVGTDIQYCKPGNHDRMVSRYFSEAEQHALEGCLDVAQKDALFYKIWTRKEAYGKLTGKGITDAIAVDVMLVEGVVWEEYQIGETYQIAVCRFEAEKE